MAEQAQVAGIVLAAGFSRRLGRPKQTIVLAGETLLARAARTALDAGLSPVVLVLNAALLEADRAAVEALESNRCTVVVNGDAAEGIASSVRAGVASLRNSAIQGAVLLTCDQVAVTPEHLRALCGEPAQASGSGYAGKIGVPAYFPAEQFADLLALHGDQGARGLLSGALLVPTEALALDVDTEDDVARAEGWVRRHGV